MARLQLSHLKSKRPKHRRLLLTQVSLVDPDGERYFPCVESSIVGEATVISPVHLLEDV